MNSGNNLVPIKEELERLKQYENELTSMLQSLKRTIEQSLLIDNHILDENIYNEVVDTTKKLNANVESELSIVNSNINS